MRIFDLKCSVDISSNFYGAPLTDLWKLS